MCLFKDYYDVFFGSSGPWVLLLSRLCFKLRSSKSRNILRFGSVIFDRTISRARSSLSPNNLASCSAYSTQTQLAQPDMQHVVGSGGIYKIRLQMRLLYIQMSGTYFNVIAAFTRQLSIWTHCDLDATWQEASSAEAAEEQRIKHIAWICESRLEEVSGSDNSFTRIHLRQVHAKKKKKISSAGTKKNC